MAAYLLTASVSPSLLFCWHVMARPVMCLHLENLNVTSDEKFDGNDVEANEDN